MQHLGRWGASLVAALAAGACYLGGGHAVDGGADGGADVEVDVSEASVCPPSPDAGDLPPDVAMAVGKCQLCHTSPQQNSAPFPLLRYEDFVALYGTVPRWQVAATMIDPNSIPHMPPFKLADGGSVPQLTQAEHDALAGWFAQCAPPLPEGTGCDVGEDASSDACAKDAGAD